MLDVEHVRNVEGAFNTPVVSARWTGGLGGKSSISTGALASSDYGSAGVSLGHAPWDRAQSRVDLVGTRAPREGAKGTQARLSLSQGLGDSWSVNGAIPHQTQGYRELQEATLPPSEDAMRTRNRNQLDAGLGWSHPSLGSFNANYLEGTMFNGEKSSRVGVSWGTSFKGASISVTADRGIGGADNTGNSVYASISFPLRERRRLAKGAGRLRLGDLGSYQIQSRLAAHCLTVRKWIWAW
ncbi:fimbria/pilus outer membrane usher protein [Pseudomonas vranovensis]|uniref:fimbria/pilus outer membrane usher protein n=1 Tax=Pseudomonas vranovensis TaxID=321661 RepID=UPI0003FAB288|nr:fimbria/pilus outer membrane usher protein [Pseudomonas vranovensis]